MPLPLGTCAAAYPSGWQVCFPTYNDPNIFCQYFHLCWGFFPLTSLHHSTPHGYIKRSTNCRAKSCCSTRKITGSSVRVLTEWQVNNTVCDLRMLAGLWAFTPADLHQDGCRKAWCEAQHQLETLYSSSEEKMSWYQKDISVVIIT